MEMVYELGEATADDVLAHLAESLAARIGRR